MDKGTSIGLVVALVCILGAAVVEAGSVSILFALINLPSAMIVVDGTDPELVREIMESDVAAMGERHEGRYAMFEAAGGFAPTMGIIGTVMGLVNVLSHLDKPDELGKSIATAFIATLYGVLTANVFWVPVGQRLKQRNKEEVARRQLAIEGVLAVQAGDNPRVLREKLESFLPLTLRGEEAASDEGGEAAKAA